MAISVLFHLIIDIYIYVIYVDIDERIDTQ